MELWSGEVVVGVTNVIEQEPQREHPAELPGHRTEAPGWTGGVQPYMDFSYCGILNSLWFLPFS